MVLVLIKSLDSRLFTKDSKPKRTMELNGSIKLIQLNHSASSDYLKTDALNAFGRSELMKSVANKIIIDS